MAPPRVGCVAADGALLLWDAARSVDAPATSYRVLARNASQARPTPNPGPNPNPSPNPGPSPNPNPNANPKPNPKQARPTLLWEGPGRRLWLRDRAPGSLLELSVSASAVAAGASEASAPTLLRVPDANPFLPPAQGAPVTSSGFVVAWSAWLGLGG